MDPEKNSLLKILFPNGYPEQWNYSIPFTEYLTKIGTFSSEDLLKEVPKLQEENASISEHTQELTVSNYKTFIETADCTRKSFNKFNSVENKLENLLENIPKFEEKCVHFIDESNNVNQLRKLNSITLVRNAQLLEILELPQLMENFIKDNAYEEALELATYVKKLSTKQPDIIIFKNIEKDIDKLWNIMLNKLLQQLSTDIQLPKCLQIVGHLRRMSVFNENELRLKFLLARNTWLSNNLKTIPKDDANYHLKRTIELTRINLFNIITQYKAIFNDDVHSPLSLAKDKCINSNCIFFEWIKEKINEFLNVLEEDLSRDITSIDTILGQCMYFGLSFSKVGCDFRILIMPLFLKAILSNFTKDITTATRHFLENMEKFTLIKKNHAKVPWKNRNNDSMQPPDSLLEFYPFADYINKILTSLNTLRLCAPIAILNEVVNAIEDSLLIVSSSICTLYAQEHQAFSSNANESFIRLCMCFIDDLVPYLQKAIHIIYPPNAITQYLGVNLQLLQDNQFTYLNRNKIINDVKLLLPTNQLSS